MANIHGNELGIYINVSTADLAAFADDVPVLDYTWTDGNADADQGTAGADADEGNWVLVACSTSCSLNLSNATIETTCKASNSGALTDASVRHTIAGQQTWNMTVDGLVDFNEAVGSETGFAKLMDLAIDRTEILVAFSTGVDGNIEYAGKGFISSIDATAGVDDFATYSATIEGNGTLDKRTTDTDASA